MCLTPGVAGEGDAACGLGGVYQQMGEYEKALQYHQLDLQLAEVTANPVCQCEFSTPASLSATRGDAVGLEPEREFCSHPTRTILKSPPCRVRGMRVNIRI